MQKSILNLVLVSVLVLAFGLSASAERTTSDRESKLAKAKAKVKPTEVKRESSVTPPSSSSNSSDSQPITPSETTTQSTTTPQEVRQDSPLTAAAAEPMAGEQIKWQVVSGGGVRSTSPGYILGGTIGQTVVGRTTSLGYTLSNGYWQDWDSFVTSCCIGTTGNVNKSAVESPDLSDLSLLIAFLTMTPKPALPCLPEANVNGSVAPNPDLSDLSLLIAFLTMTPKPVLPNCS